MAGFDYYDREGKPLTRDEFHALLKSDPGEDGIKRVASDHVGDVWISTVWLGINHNYGGDGPPIIFETMIFGGEYDVDQWRYYTEAEALAGHAAAVALVRGDAEL